VELRWRPVDRQATLTRSSWQAAPTKAYPALGERHGESVCVAGIRGSCQQSEWIRLFPVPFRDLPADQQFSKYDVIELLARRVTRDRRPESWEPVASSIKILHHIGSDDGWRRRYDWLEPPVVGSMCEIQAAWASDGHPTLATFRPAQILEVLAEPVKARTSGKQGIAAQGSLLDPSRQALEDVPFKFYYRYQCSRRAAALTGCLFLIGKSASPGAAGATGMASPGRLIKSVRSGSTWVDPTETCTFLWGTTAGTVPGLHMLLPHVAAAHLLYKTGRTLHANSALVEGTHALSDEVQDLTSHQFASADPLVLRLPVSGIATCFVRRNAIGGVSVVIRPEGGADDTKLKSSLPVPAVAYEDFRHLLEKAVTAARVMDGAPPEQAP